MNLTGKRFKLWREYGALNSRPILMPLVAVLLAVVVLFLILLIMSIPTLMLFGAFYFMVEWLATAVCGIIAVVERNQSSYSKLEESKEAQRGKWGSMASTEMPTSMMVVMMERERRR